MKLRKGGVEHLMLVRVVQKVERGQVVVSPVGSVVRLCRLDQCPCRPTDREPGKRPFVLRRGFLDVGDELVGVVVDRELRAEDLRLPALRLDELPDDLIQSGAEMVGPLGSGQAPLKARGKRVNHDVYETVTRAGVVLRDDLVRVSLGFRKQACRLVPESVQVLVSPIQLGPDAIQPFHGVTSP